MKNKLEKMPEINISIGFFIFIIGIVFFGDEKIFFLAAIAAFFHEFAHLLMIYICGGRASAINFSIYGAHIDLKKYPILSYQKEILIAAAGPAMSLVVAYLFSVAGTYFSYECLYIISGMSLILGLLNILPAYPLDGGRILRCSIMLINEKNAEAVTVISGGICAAITLFICSLINFKMGFQMSLTIFCSFISLSFVKHILLRKSAI